MNDVRGYIEQLDKSMTRKEKLFFLNKINVRQYDYIIDFCCANGRLLHEVDKQLPKKCATKLIGIDKSNEIRIEYEFKHSFTKAKTLNEIQGLIAGTKVLLILSSVLHELSALTIIDQLEPFVSAYIDTICIRDMSFDFSCKINTVDVARFLVGLSDEQYKQLVQVVRHSDDFWDDGVQLVDDKIYEFLLKYTYTANWQSEIKENYFNSSTSIFLNYLLYGNKWQTIYKERYILPYKKRQVKKDFGYKMTANTHIKLIVKRSNKDVPISQ